MNEMKTYARYFSAKPLLSKGALFNLALSDRSDGKTFDIKYRTLEDYLKDKSQHMLIRRWSTEITTSMASTFFNEVFDKKPEMAAAFEGMEFKGTTSGVWLRPRVPEGEKNTHPWDQIIYLVPLTKAGKLKSNWDVKRIVEIDYDEYAPLDGRYIKDEMIYLLELYKSIDRDRYTTRLCVFGNKIDPFNPFFSFFGLDLSIDKNKMRTYRNGTLAVQIYSCLEHREHVAASPFNDLVAGTSYEGYNAGSILHASYFPTYKVDKQNDKLLFRFITPHGKGSVWRISGNRGIVVSDLYPGEGLLIAHQPTQGADVVISNRYRLTQLESLRAYYQYNQLYLSSTAQHANTLYLLQRA